MDLEEAIVRGNHKSARENTQELVNMVSKDVTLGCQLPVSIDAIMKVKHSCIQHYGITLQSTA